MSARRNRNRDRRVVLTERESMPNISAGVTIRLNEDHVEVDQVIKAMPGMILFNTQPKRIALRRADVDSPLEANETDLRDPPEDFQRCAQVVTMNSKYRISDDDDDDDGEDGSNPFESDLIHGQVSNSL